METQIEEILDFRQVVAMINEELHAKGIFDIEYMLINNDIADVFQVLNDNSERYLLIKDDNDKYSNGATFQDLLYMYSQYVKERYDSLLIKDGKNDQTADKYYNKLKEAVKDKNGQYLQYSKNDIGMIQQDVQKTLTLMREAIQAYYKVYNNKELVAVLSTDNIETDDYLEFSIKGRELLHLLGVTAEQLRNNPDFIRLTGKKNMNVEEILEWIVKDIDGNEDLLQDNEDFLKRIEKNNFELSKLQFDKNTQTRILNYHKVRTKSQAFLKYGPFEKVSLVAKLQNGKSLSKNSKSNIAMISHAECFKKYPWAYFGSVQEPNNKYIETLLIDSASGKKELFKGSTPAIVKGVYPLDGDGGVRIFSDDEQLSLFCEAYNDFQDTMNFENLRQYFVELLAKKEYNDSTGGRKK